MLKTTQDYLSNLLTDSGMKTRVLFTFKELKATLESHVSAVLLLKDGYVRSHAKKTFDDNGVRKIRKKLYDRNITYSVVIGDYNIDKCGVTVNNFMAGLQDGIYIDGNYTEISMSEVDWVYKEDGILKAEIAAQFEITFKGGVYKDSVLKTFTDVDITVETEGK